jgi:hypothetical protein
MTTPLQSSPVRRRITFGPGLVLALIASALIWNRQHTPPLPPPPGHVVYEADATGVMRRVSQPSAPTLPALWKPEPSSLLQMKALKLTERQRHSIEAAQQDWARQRAVLEEQMRQSVASTPREHATADGIAAGLNGYSALSRQYESDRSLAWSRALSVLSPLQQFLAVSPERQTEVER